CWLYFIGARVF
nr:immunoglobulin light chain junction region [Macaca mulatta]